MLKFIFYLSISLILYSCNSSSSNYGYVDTSSPAKKSHVAKPKVNSLKYIVRKGDTLSAISRMSGVPVERISHFNKLHNSNIHVGQVIYLPGIYRLEQPSTVLPRVEVVPRNLWAKYPIKGNINPMGKVTKITIHHTADSVNSNRTRDIEVIQRIESDHRNNRNFACIGYHFIIGRDGTVYEGRPLKYQGAHAYPENPQNIGISLVGNFNKSYPQKAQLSSLTALISQLCNRYKISRQQIFGHVHIGKTECPGKHLSNWLETYKRRIK